MKSDILTATRIVLLALVLLIGIGFYMSIDHTTEITPDPKAETVTTDEAEYTMDAEPEETWDCLGEFELTAYCPCEICCGYWATVRPTGENGNPIVYTSSGAIAEAGTTIAVDPDIIPYGSKVKINDHIYIAQDTGGSITGEHIDIYFNDHAAALEFGCQEALVYVQVNR